MDLQKRIVELENLTECYGWTELGQALSIIKELQSQPKGNYFLRTQIKNLQEQNKQLIQDLPRALGLLEGVVVFKDMEEFNKEGAVKIIEEVIGILKSKIEV